MMKINYFNLETFSFLEDCLNNDFLVNLGLDIPEVENKCKK